MAEPWVSVEKVAAHLGVGKASIYRWIEHRDLPGTKIGKLWKLKLSEVESWMRGSGAVEASVRARSATPVAGPPRSRAPGSVVLVIDDDELIRDTLRDFLSDEGFRALLASDGAEAIALLDSGSPRPDLIILDLGMPNMDGWQFREQQASDPRFSSIPVIVVTANRVANMNAAALLRKPLNLNDLATAIERLTERR